MYNYLWLNVYILINYYRINMRFILRECYLFIDYQDTAMLINLKHEFCYLVISETRGLNYLAVYGMCFLYSDFFKRIIFFYLSLLNKSQLYFYLHTFVKKKHPRF